MFSLWILCAWGVLAVICVCSFAWLLVAGLAAAGWVSGGLNGWRFAS